MINICLDMQTGTFDVEGISFVIDGEDSRDQALKMIEYILNKAYYAGERLCLEVKDKEGNYKEIERWSSS